MTVNEVFERVSELRPAVYDETGLRGKLLDLENMIRTEVHGGDPVDALSDTDALSVRSPYGDLYVQYLLAQIDFSDMELAQYNADMQMFSATYTEYAAAYRRANRPNPGEQVSGYV